MLRSGHDDDVLDIAFNLSGSMFVTTSADSTGRVYDSQTFECLCILTGHTAEIVKVCFNPQGTRILTASADKTARLWEAHSGNCLQVLEGHTEELFCCGFNYEGTMAITGAAMLPSNIHTHTHTHKHLTHYPIHTYHRCYVQICTYTFIRHYLTDCAPLLLLTAPWCPQEAKTTWFAFGDDVINTKQGSFYKLY